MRAIWTGAIGFGLVNIPVKFYSAIEESELNLDMLDKNDMAHIRYKRVNEQTVKEAHPLVYYVFDLLEWNDTDLQQMTLVERKTFLKELLAMQPSPLIRYSDHLMYKGIALYEQVTAMQLEGIMAKKRNSRYVQNFRSKEWLKIKNVQTMEAIIVGYTEPSRSRSAFGSLILAED